MRPARIPLLGFVGLQHFACAVYTGELARAFPAGLSRAWPLRGLGFTLISPSPFGSILISGGFSLGNSKLDGDITFWNNEKKFGWIVGAHRGQRIFFKLASVIPDWKLSRSWAFVPQPVTFVLSDPLDHKNRKFATEIQPLFSQGDLEKEDLLSYREISSVQEIRQTHGWLLRPCGDTIFFHFEDVFENFRDRWKHLAPGTPVFHGVRTESPGRTKATYIELYSPEELLEPVAEAEPEPEPELEAVS